MALCGICFGEIKIAHANRTNEHPSKEASAFFYVEDEILVDIDTVQMCKVVQKKSTEDLLISLDDRS